ncbi:type 2 isopentenyl-diphosphate Delta-isomerase [Companilactobacillus allii]|uniref:Isopentenyl-diphosphate delta-isomerase n=1 Tax=Companilactobacillus allii TaxID=1847728 RepID=A0A1P8Q4L8_9LACO|nr:type 2 isopentenyl-diphosphate Delta-isomerase [Companilactobacillus allii]APX72804.1 type 2 isopentenyl-diphosphate Delta-isomerase [Companilactobacillus allii]USQ67593.1 type 2 isopentenyl-diphosphate Delta-isomerase [Companilactobacillus allii]
MPKQDEQIQRKVEHLFLAEKYFTEESFTDFDGIRLLHDALPELNYRNIDLTTNILGYESNLPFYFNAITGGSKQSARFNMELSKLASTLGIPVSSGSMGVYLRIPDTADTFTPLRENNPDGFVMANVSAKVTPKQAKSAIDLLNANALQIHLNLIQEMAMPEGDRKFFWLDNIKKIVEEVKIPVIVKEVGFGMSNDSINKLINIGVKYIDISGFGGTDFAQIESARNHEIDLTYLDQFSLSTVESLIEAQPELKRVTIFASGGIRTPMDVVKAIRMGASGVGISGLVLHHLQKYSLEEATLFFESFAKQIQIIMAVIGAKNIDDIKKVPIIFDENLTNYSKQRKIDLPS